MSRWSVEWTVRGFSPSGAETYRMSTEGGERAPLAYEVKASRLRPGEAVELARDGELVERSEGK